MDYKSMGWQSLGEPLAEVAQDTISGQMTVLRFEWEKENIFV